MLALQLLRWVPLFGAVLASHGIHQTNRNVKHTFISQGSELVWKWAVGFRFWSYMVGHEWEPKQSVLPVLFRVYLLS